MKNHGEKLSDVDSSSNMSNSMSSDKKETNKDPPNPGNGMHQCVNAFVNDGAQAASKTST